MNNSEFNVEDVFFGALLGALLGTATGLWTDISCMILLAMLFVAFGITLQIFSSHKCEIWNKVRWGIGFIIGSIWVITILSSIVSSKDRKYVTFFSIIWGIWVAICVIKLVFYTIRRAR